MPARRSRRRGTSRRPPGGRPEQGRAHPVCRIREQAPGERTAVPERGLGQRQTIDGHGDDRFGFGALVHQGQCALSSGPLPQRSAAAAVGGGYGRSVPAGRSRRTVERSSGHTHHDREPGGGFPQTWPVIAQFSPQQQEVPRQAWLHPPGGQGHEVTSVVVCEAVPVVHGDHLAHGFHDSLPCRLRECRWVTGFRGLQGFKRHGEQLGHEAKPEAARRPFPRLPPADLLAGQCGPSGHVAEMDGQVPLRPAPAVPKDFDQLSDAHGLSLATRTATGRRIGQRYTWSMTKTYPSDPVELPLWQDAVPSPRAGCSTCSEISTHREQRRSARDHSGVSDANVVMLRHQAGGCPA